MTSKKLLRGVAGVLILLVTAFGIHKVFTNSINVHDVLDRISDFSPLDIGIIVVLSTAMMAVRAYRFYLLLKDAGQKLSFWQALKVFITGQAFSPLPAGEGVRPALLKKEADIEVEDSVTPMIMLGVTEMIVAVTIAMVGSIFLGILRVAAIIASIGLLGLVWILVNHKLVIAVVSKLPNRKMIKKAGDSVVRTQKEVKQALFRRHSWYPSKLLLITLVLALLTDLFGAGVIYVIARHFQLPLSLLLSLYVFAAATVLGELVPFAPGGIGATEGGMTGILVVSGIGLSSSLVVVLLFRAATLVYGVALGLVFLLLFYTGEYYWKIRNLIKK